jgi:hypothetical protein
VETLAAAAWRWWMARPPAMAAVLFIHGTAAVDALALASMQMLSLSVLRA